VTARLEKAQASRKVRSMKSMYFSGDEK